MPHRTRRITTHGLNIGRLYQSKNIYSQTNLFLTNIGCNARHICSNNNSSSSHNLKTHPQQLRRQSLLHRSFTLKARENNKLHYPIPHQTQTHYLVLLLYRIGKHGSIPKDEDTTYILLFFCQMDEQSPLRKKTIQPLILLVWFWFM